MDKKIVYVGMRATVWEHRCVRAYAAGLGVTVSQLIRARIVDQAVRPVREAVAAEVPDDGDLQA